MLLERKRREGKRGEGKGEGSCERGLGKEGS